MSWTVPFYDLSLGTEEHQAVMKTLASNWLTVGPKIEAFEQEFTKRCGEGLHGVAVSSATAALHLSLLTLGLGEEDEVIVPSMTFVATANVVRYTGAKVVFADIASEENWLVDASSIEACITPRTKAVIVVHYAGIPCDMTPIVALCEKHNIQLIEDCAHAPLVTYQGDSVGTFGYAGCFSFFSNKNITTGEGGMSITRDAELAARWKSLRSHGITSSTYQRFKAHQSGYDVAELGYNYRMDEMRASLGLVQLEHYPQALAKRKALYENYVQLLQQKQVPVTVPFLSHQGESAYHIFPVLLPTAANREEVIARLKDAGIQTSIHYAPVHTFTAYQHHEANVPVTEAIADYILTLPFFATMRHKQLSHVIDTLQEVLS